MKFDEERFRQPMDVLMQPHRLPHASVSTGHRSYQRLPRELTLSLNSLMLSAESPEEEVGCFFRKMCLGRRSELQAELPGPPDFSN